MKRLILNVYRGRTLLQQIGEVLQMSDLVLNPSDKFAVHVKTSQLVVYVYLGNCVLYTLVLRRRLLEVQIACAACRFVFYYE